MTIRERIAAWLAPEMKHYADRHYEMTSAMRLEKWWFGKEFPDVRDAYERLLANDYNGSRCLNDTAMPLDVPWQIDKFREELRRRRDKTRNAGTVG